MKDNVELQKIKEARYEILRPPLEHCTSVDNNLAPGPYSVLPSRCFADNRLRGATFRVLGILCSHTNQRSGLVYVNQLTIGNRLGISKQAVSRQMRLLEKCGYIKKIWKENPLRKQGRKGATWRLIYDPAVTDEDILAHNKPKYVEEQDAKETLEVIQKAVDNSAKSVDNSQKVIPEVDSGDQKVIPQVDQGSTKVIPQVDSKGKKVAPQVDHNNITYSYKRNNRELARKLCKVYASESVRRLGSMAGWRWDERQESVVERWLQAGVDKSRISKHLLSSLTYHAKEGTRPPFSLAYYDNYFVPKDKPSIKEVLKRTVNRSKFTAVAQRTRSGRK